MKKMFNFCLLTFLIILLSACTKVSDPSMPEVRGDEVFLSEVELTQLINLSTTEEPEHFISKLDLNSEMLLYINTLDGLNTSSLKMTVTGEQGFTGTDSQSYKISSELKTDVTIEIERDDQIVSSVITKNDVGYYFTYPNAYFRIDASLKSDINGLKSYQTVESQKYRNASLGYHDFYINTMGYNEEFGLQTTFKSVIDSHLTPDYKVYKDQNRYSIVFQLSSELMEEQIEQSDLMELSNITLTDLDDSYGEFIIVIQDQKVIDIGYHVYIDTIIFAQQAGMDVYGPAKVDIRVRYHSNQDEFPSMPEDFEQYEFQQYGSLGIESIL